MEEQIATTVDDGQIADLVDDEESWPAEEADAFLQAAFAFGPCQRGDEFGDGAEIDALPSLRGLDGKRNGQMALACPGGPRKWTTSQRATKPSWESVMIRSRSSEGWREKSKPASVLIVARRPMRSAVLIRLFSRRVNSSERRMFMASRAAISPCSSRRTT